MGKIQALWRKIKRRSSSGELRLADRRIAVADAIATIDLFLGKEDGALTPHVTGHATETVGPMGAGTVIVTADDDPVRTAVRTRGRFSRGVRDVSCRFQSGYLIPTVGVITNVYTPFRLDLYAL